MTREQVYWHFVSPGHPGSCWRWQGVIASVGYGMVTIDGAQVYAHRLAWEVANGRPVPNGLLVRHVCDNRWCANPAHLITGSFGDNMQDAIDRRRFCHSGAHWNAKLTPEGVQQIRQLAKEGLYHREIAARFGVSRSAVTNVVNGKAWRGA